MFAEIMAFFASIKEIAKAVNLLTEEVKGMRQDAINSALDNIRKDVNETITQIQNAKSNEDRAKLARDLNARISK